MKLTQDNKIKSTCEVLFLKPKIFIAKPIPKEVKKYLGRHCEYRIWDKKEPIPKRILMKEISEVHGLMIPDGDISEELLKHTNKLQVVSNISVGYDSFNIKAMKKRNIIGTHTPSVLDESVADLAFGLILAVSRRIVESNCAMKKGLWEDTTDIFLGSDVNQSTLGIIGMGRIGEKVARRATSGFNMNVLYYNRSRKYNVEKKYGAIYSKLDDLLKQSDYVLVLLPLTESTRHFIGEKQFNIMKKDSFFINVSRGSIVNEEALINALESKKILGAGLDVYEEEPIEKSNRLLKMDNVVTTPHIGSATFKTRFNMAMLAAENLLNVIIHKKPSNVVPELKELIDKYHKF